MSKGNIATVSSISKSIDNHANIAGLQSVLRNAIFDAISENDIQEIVKRQVQLAKHGDPASLQFVMKYALGFGQHVTLNQVNVVSPDLAARAIKGVFQDE